MAKVLVSVSTNGYHKMGNLLNPLVPFTLKSGQGLANGGQSQWSSFRSCKDTFLLRPYLPSSDQTNFN